MSNLQEERKSKMISVNIFDRLNSIIKEEAPFLRIESERSDSAGKEWTYYNIRLQKSRYVDDENHPLNVTKELRSDIESFLNSNKIKIAWNNSYTTFWEIN